MVSGTVESVVVEEVAGVVDVASVVVGVVAVVSDNVVQPAPQARTNNAHTTRFRILFQDTETSAAGKSHVEHLFPTFGRTDVPIDPPG